MIASADEFVKLRRSHVPDEYFRAANEEAPTYVWLEVIERFRDMRSWVAHNKTVPIEILDILATDPDRDVRYTVATKRKLTSQLFAQLAADPDDGVRRRLACNRKIPLELLESLASDRSEFVRQAARDRLECRRSGQ